MTQQRSNLRPTRRTLASVLVAVSLSAGIVGACGDDDDSTATTVGNVLPPVIADLTAIDGTTVEVKVGGAIDLTGDSKTFTDWTATITDPKIAEFTPGRNEGGASFNPGLKGLAPGTTAVQLTNSTSATSVSFTVTVTAA
jgi:hypothetical protein